MNSGVRPGDRGPLVWAIERGKPEEIAGVVTALIAAGADVHTSVGGEYDSSVAFEACRLPGAFKPLFAGGIDVNARLGLTLGHVGRATGATLLIECANLYPTVRELLADGADPTLASADGTTALDAARKSKCDECAQAIEEAIAKRHP